MGDVGENLRGRVEYYRVSMQMRVHFLRRVMKWISNEFQCDLRMGDLLFRAAREQDNAIFYYNS